MLTVNLDIIMPLPIGFNSWFSSWFKIEAGVHQGCVLAPDSFAAGMDWLLDRTVDFCSICVAFGQIDREPRGVSLAEKRTNFFYMILSVAYGSSSDWTSAGSLVVGVSVSDVETHQDY